MQGKITKSSTRPHMGLGAEAPAAQSAKPGLIEVQHERRDLASFPKEVQKHLKEEVPLIEKRRLFRRRKADRALVKTETMTQIETIGDLKTLQDAGYHFTAEQEANLESGIGILLLWILAFVACGWMIGHALGYL